MASDNTHDTIGWLSAVWLLAIDVMALFAIGLTSVGLLFLLGGESGGGLEPYYREVAKHCMSAESLVKYFGLIALYAAGLETALRYFQLSVE